MSVSPPTAKTPYWQYHFEIGGDRFRGSTKKKTKREAEAVERQVRLDAEAEIAARNAAGGQSARLKDVIDRYWTEVGQHHGRSDDTASQIQLLRDFFTDDRLITDITTDDVTQLIAWRRGHPGKRPGELLANATVNQTTMRLRALFTRAGKWGIPLPKQPDWSDRALWLKKPDERVRFLVGDEQARIEAATRDDYAALLTFARMTGLRKHECLLKWAHVDWEGGWIRRPGKGGKVVKTRLTPPIRALLEAEYGRHPIWVFTYVAQYAVPGKKIARGERRPITTQGLNSAWQVIQAAAGLTGTDGFRFHDFRHDFATKLMRHKGNLKVVSKALNHANTRVTERYAHVTDDDVADALEDFHEPMAAEQRQKTRQTAKRKKA